MYWIFLIKGSPQTVYLLPSDSLAVAKALHAVNASETVEGMKEAADDLMAEVM